MLLLWALFHADHICSGERSPGMGACSDTGLCLAMVDKDEGQAKCVSFDKGYREGPQHRAWSNEF